MSGAYEVPAPFSSTGEDWPRVWSALARRLHDQDWTKEELRLRQNTLIEHFCEHGIGRSRASALLQDHFAGAVFSGGCNAQTQ